MIPRLLHSLWHDRAVCPTCGGSGYLLLRDREPVVEVSFYCAGTLGTERTFPRRIERAVAQVAARDREYGLEWWPRVLAWTQGPRVGAPPTFGARTEPLPPLRPFLLPTSTPTRRPA